MTLWIDAQLSPALARWINDHFDDIQAASVRSLGLRDAKDGDIFEAARTANAIVMSKDSDFVQLVIQRGTPPRLLWVTCGNTSNAFMRSILATALPDAIKLLRRGEDIVEISDSP